MEAIKKKQGQWGWACEPAFYGFPRNHIQIWNGLNQTIIRTDYLSAEQADFIVKCINGVSDKHFLDMTKEEQEATNEKDLREIALYYGGWDALRKVIDQLENNENEVAYERRNGDAWSCGFADNH
jgi:hypothetical protein